jgi:hypothetical protein
MYKTRSGLVHAGVRHRCAKKRSGRSGNHSRPGENFSRIVTFIAFFSSPWEDENPIQTCTYVRNTRFPRRRGPKIKNRVSPREPLDRDCGLPRWYR